VTTADTADHAPIYDSLIAEHGDVVAAARQAAEETERDMNEALDWDRPSPAE